MRSIDYIILFLNSHQTEVTFIKELKPANITIESRLFQTEADPVATVEDFFVSQLIKLSNNIAMWLIMCLQVESQDYRVFFLNSYTGPAKKIICEVGIPYMHGTS